MAVLALVQAACFVEIHHVRDPAAAFRKARAQALVVAPVVKTSSTRITRVPLSWQPARTAKAWRTLAARCLRVSNV